MRDADRAPCALPVLGGSARRVDGRGVGVSMSPHYVDRMTTPGQRQKWVALSAPTITMIVLGVVLISGSLGSGIHPSG